MPDPLVLNIDPRKVQRLLNTDDTKQMITIVAQEAEGLMKFFVAVLTGNLRRSITHRIYVDDNAWIALVGTNVLYGFFQEVGTRFHPPHPFVRPTIEALERKYG